jgi:hypothetical protein
VTWRLAPLCNRVTFSVESSLGFLPLHGADDTCGQRGQSPAQGVAVFEPGGFLTLEWTTDGIVYRASVDVDTLDGAWISSAGQDGLLRLVAAQGPTGPAGPGPAPGG